VQAAALVSKRPTAPATDKYLIAIPGTDQLPFNRSVNDAARVPVKILIQNVVLPIAASRDPSEQAVPSSDRKTRIAEWRSMAVLLMRVVLPVF
jgi:hypothetical protein